MLNRAFITKTTSGKLGFRNRKSTQDDLLLTDVGVRFPIPFGRIQGGGGDVIQDDIIQDGDLTYSQHEGA